MHIVLLGRSFAILRLLFVTLVLWVGAPAVHATGQPGAALELAEAQFVLAGKIPPPTDAAWAPVSLPDRWRSSRPGVGGDGWYRFRLPETLPANPVAVFIEEACVNLEVWLNGSLVGSGGHMTEPVTRNCYQPQFFTLPAALLKASDNTLLIHLVAYPHTHGVAVQRTGALSAPTLGPLDALQDRYEDEMFLRVGINQSLALLEAAMGLAMLLLWSMRRRDTVYLYFGLLMLCWSLVTARLLVREWPGYREFEWLTISLTALVASVAMIFLMRYAERRMPRLEKLLWAIPPGIAAVFWWLPSERYFQFATPWYLFLRVETFLGMAAFLVWAWRRRHPDFWVMVTAMGAVAATLALESLGRHGLVPITTKHYVNFALPVFFLVIGWRLVRLFAGALQNAEDSLAELERRVDERSREISAAYEELGRVRQVQAAAAERERIAADLHDDLGARLLMITHRAGGTPLAELARAAMQDLRTLIYGLNSGTVPLVDAAADWRAEAMARAESAGFELTWSADGLPAEAMLVPQARSAVERVLREGITNALRHSGGTRLSVTLTCKAGTLELRVRDDGRAGPPEHWAPGYGTRSMMGRAARLGAQVSWRSLPEGGTELAYRLGLDASEITPDPDSAPPGPPPPASPR